MDIYNAIKNLNTQFAFEPKIENPDKFTQHFLLTKGAGFIVAGMGGSHHAADLIKVWNPYYNLTVHPDYGLPSIPEKDLKNYFLVASSYSGNTEEPIDAYEQAQKRGMNVGAISIGGKLLNLAKKDGVPFIQIPDTGIQPRSAVGYMFMATLKITGGEEALKEAAKLSDLLKPPEYEEMGRALAERLAGHTPLIYISLRNAALANNWKIRFNETAKIPAYYNVFPELNHNEMTGFDVKGSTRPLTEKFYIIFLKDPDDPPKIQKRIEITEKLYRDRGLKTEIIQLTGENIFHKIFASISLADWTAYYTAKIYGADPEQVPMVEEFKSLIQK